MKQFLLLMFVFAGGFLRAQTSTDTKMTTQSPPSADEIVQKACKQAASEKKNVMVMFHASWCVWCHKMDSSMNDETVKKFFDDNYVITHLVVYESKDKKNLENPAAMELLASYNGANQGIPFWVVIDKNGKMLADCFIRPENADPKAQAASIGCPASEKEVDAFIKVLRKTSRITADQETAIVKRFRQNESH